MVGKVLILEDNCIEAEYIKSIVLEVMPDIQVYMAATLQDAYLYTMDQTINLFLVDIILDTKASGDTSGIRFAQMIREIERYYFTPIIFISSLIDQELIAYRELKSYAFIEKPFNDKTAKSEIAKALRFMNIQTRDVQLCFRTDGILIPMKVSELVYVKMDKHKMHIFNCHHDELILSGKTCKGLLKEADSRTLLQCGSGTIINMGYIKNIDLTNRYITLIDNFGILSIGTRFKRKVADEILQC